MILSLFVVYALTHLLILVLVVMMKAKELKAKIYSHAHSLILSLCGLPQMLILSIILSLAVSALSLLFSFEPFSSFHTWNA